jgi:O-antigen/teichoic acid export membrane protein
VAVVASVVALGALALGALAGPVLELAFGHGYRGDAEVLRLLCLGAIPSTVSIGLAPVVAMLHRRAFVRWILVALAVDVTLNLLLLPHHLGLGAAWATVASMTVSATGMVVTLVRTPEASA